ncbi:MAG: gamma-glutamylcyclotransferase [Candidatus Obscuribacterales bacterium]
MNKTKRRLKRLRRKEEKKKKEIRMAASSGARYGFCEVLERRLSSKFTPDFLERKLERMIPMFFYGTLKKGQRAHSFLKGAEFVSEAKTASQSFEMFRTSPGDEKDFPVVMQSVASKPESGVIWGEVWNVDPITLLEIDRMEGNTELYRRVQRFVWLTDIDVEGKPNLHPSAKVWMYIGVPKYWEDWPLVRAKQNKKDGKVPWYEWEAERYSSFGMGFEFALDNIDKRVKEVRCG